MMKILEFPHSHYCEKAKWALDYKGIDFLPVAIMPGVHVFTVKRYASQTYVPVLLNDNKVIQGSSEIISYLDEEIYKNQLTPSDNKVKAACLEFEKKMDVLLGENIRQILYHRLLAYPDFIRYCFTHPLPQYKQSIFKLLYPLLRFKIYRTYVISDKQVAVARREFDTTMHDLGKRLEGKNYLFDNQFSRADLSISAMLSFLAMPAEHPFPWIEYPDVEIRSFYQSYQDHPVILWVKNMYLLHRLKS